MLLHRLMNVTKLPFQLLGNPLFLPGTFRERRVLNMLSLFVHFAYLVKFPLRRPWNYSLRNPQPRRQPWAIMWGSAISRSHRGGG